MRAFRFITLAFLLATLSACATSFDTKGRFHKVRKNETIQTIARAYGVGVQDTAELNNIEDLRELEVGARIYIPPKHKRAGFKRLPFGKYLGEEKVAKRKPIFSKHRDKKDVQEDEETATIKVDHGRFSWPVVSTVSSPFGIRNGRRHDGVDISAKEGTPIKAADGGKVVFSGAMKGYGNLVILRHKDNFFTIYAHNSKNLAKKGDTVKEGGTIAKVGHTGRSSGSHLHFEVRNGQTARNPLFFLPHKKETGLAKK